MLLGVEIGSCNSRKLSRSIEDFGRNNSTSVECEKSKHMQMSLEFLSKY